MIFQIVLTVIGLLSCASVWWAVFAKSKEASFKFAVCSVLCAAFCVIGNLLLGFVAPACIWGLCVVLGSISLYRRGW